MLWPLFPPPPIIRVRRRPAPVPVREDDELIAAARDGDVDAFHELVERHQSAVFNIVLRTVKDPGIA